MGKKKSWVEKLNDSKDLPKVVEITGKMSRRWGENRLRAKHVHGSDLMYKEK